MLVRFGGGTPIPHLSQKIEKGGRRKKKKLYKGEIEHGERPPKSRYRA